MRDEKRQRRCRLGGEGVKGGSRGAGNVPGGDGGEGRGEGRRGELRYVNGRSDARAERDR